MKCPDIHGMRGKPSNDSLINTDAELMEKGVSDNVLRGLLPNEENIELKEPVVAGGVVYRAIKRTVDVLGSVAALVVLAVPMVYVAIRIKLESPGPVFYSQVRVGWKEKNFKIYIFRSMYVDAEADGPQWAAKNDDRVTPFGRKLRDCRFDEVPQFWNVIKGDMSLVGPRPERPVFCKAFEKRISGWHYRTLVKPGISGLAQVIGGYEMLPSEKVALDLEYIEERSVRMDVWILAQTLPIVAKKQSAR